MNNKSINTRKLSWDEFHLMVLNLYQKMLPNFADYVLFPIPRGGVIPGIILSHCSDNSFQIEYDLDKIQHCSRPLLIEDILDTGRTATRIFEKYSKEYPIVSLFYKESSIVKPELYCEKTSDWIIFPYEKENSAGIYNHTV